MKGKSIHQFMCDILFFSLIFFWADQTIWGRFIYIFIVTIYQCIETGSWYFTKSSINFQVLTAMNFDYVWNGHKEMLLVIPFLCMILGLIILADIKLKSYELVSVDPNQYMIVTLFILVFLYEFSYKLHISLYPFSNSLTPLSNQKTKISKYFESREALIKVPPKRLMKNLIFYQIESFEQQSMGKYNKYYPNVMPFVSNYSARGTFISNMISQPYTTWTSGSIFATHCGMPHVVTDITWNVLGRTAQTSDWPNITCFPDILNMTGYKSIAVASDDLGIMKTREFFQKHHMTVYDNKIHHMKNDWNTTNYIITELFPMLEKSQPFYLFATDADTHPPTRVDKRCQKRLSGPNTIRSFDCFDQIFERFVKAYENSSFFRNTLFVVLGDHLMYGNSNGVYEPPRKLSMFMPYEMKKDINKETTLYDVAPTIMDMLGIEYWPKFPFGTNLYSINIGQYPQQEDFSIIYNILHNTIDKNSKNITCSGNKGFCDADSYFVDRKSMFKMK